MRTSAPHKRASTDKRWRPGGTLGRNNSAGGGSREVGGRGRGRGGKMRGGLRGAGRAKEPEWKGIASADEDESEGEAEQVSEEEADDAASADEGSEQPAEAAPAAAVLGKKPRRKAGGPGKKGKVFVEEKSDLLSLVASIAGEEEAKAKSRLIRAKEKPFKAPPPPQNQQGEAKKKQLDAARAVVAARTKANKDRRKAADAPKLAQTPSSEGKKRVSFA